MKRTILKSLIKDNWKLLLVILTFLSAFLLVSFFRGDFSHFDSTVNLWVPSIQSSNSTNIALIISFAFDTYSLLVISVGVAAFLFIKNHKDESLLLLGAMGGTAIIVEAIKLLVHSPRPLNALVVDYSYSFPSGHTTGTVVFCGLLTYVAWQHLRKNKVRQIVAAFAVALTLVVGFDRIYLNVHWFSDVLGGYLLGIFWVALSILVFGYLRKQRVFQTNNFKIVSKLFLVLSVITGFGIILTQWLHFKVLVGSLISFLFTLSNSATLLMTIGYVGLFVVIFSESGLFLGFFLPGDSLLFTAGILASQDLFDITLIVILAVVGAIIGDSFGYAFGRKVGPLLERKKPRFITAETIEQIKDFYHSQGAKAILLARFVPVGRTFVPILAGTTQMNYRSFLSYNVLGGLAWGLIMPIIGFYIGRSIPNVQSYIYPIIVAIVVISILPWAIKFLAKKRLNISVYKNNHAESEW
jgi:membrane protein DedA with SNARE-associated domain/membrane-associated phospholipid phosphatase